MGTRKMTLVHAVAGATRPSQVITWLQDDGTAEVLTDATLSGKLRSKRTGIVSDVVGDLTVTDGANGEFTWDYHADDVAVAGFFDVQFTATFGSSPSPARTVSAMWEVKEALA